MALEDLIPDGVSTDGDRSIGSFENQQKPRGIAVSEQAWKRTLAYNPHVAINVLAFYSGKARADRETAARTLVAIMDSILQDGLEGDNLGDDRANEITRIRDKIVEDYIWD